MINILNKKHRGMTVLLLTVTLLLVSMLLILFAAQYSGMQQKISANLYKNQQAYEAAEAGLEAAIPYFRANYAAITAAQSGGYLTPYMNSSTQNVTLANNSRYTFVYTNPTANNFQLITITSTGVNADGTSTRVISQQIRSTGTTITTPTVTMTTQGNIALKNSASINNTETNSNIISGGNVSFANSSQTTTSSGIGSNSSGLGSDVQENDATIAGMTTDAFFQSVFGMSQSSVQSSANYSYTNNTDANYNSLNGVTSSVIWINQTGGTAEISNSTVIGSPTQPVVLIINGNLDIKNSVTIYGLIFIMNSTDTIFEHNSVTINGAIAATGNMQLSNSATLNYKSTVLSALPSIGGNSNYAKVPASWRDF
jgi:Tfp pilus assembly protein PilX